MTSLLINAKAPSEDMLRNLYQGDLLVFADVAPVWEFVQFTREKLEELFSPHDPEEVHKYLSPEQMAKMLGRWKPEFIHHPRSKEFVRAIIGEVGFSMADTHFDVPKPRTVFPVGHLTTGIAYAFPWHRDTWYAAPQQQINWWLPIYPIRVENAMKFDLGSFGRSVANDSDTFDYYGANRARLTTAAQVKTETQARPRASDHQAGDEIVVLLQPGSVLLFSAGHLHASIPNTSDRSRYSIDFRTVDARHVSERIGAPLQDVHCTGTALRDFVNVTTGERFAEDFVRGIYGAPPDDVLLVFDEKLLKQSPEGDKPSSGTA